MTYIVKDIIELGPGQHEVDFVREEHRLRSVGMGATDEIAAATSNPGFVLSRCILRAVATGEEVEDKSRTTAGSTPGTRFIATVDWAAYAGFRSEG